MRNTLRFLAGGCAFGLLFGLLFVRGYFVRWEQLPPTPLKNATIKDVIDGTLYIRLPNNDSYSYGYCSNNQLCWIKATQVPVPSPKYGDRYNVTVPCQLRLPMLITKPWRSVDCIQGQGHYVD